MESMNNQEFDRKVKAKLERFEAPVPVALWSKIEQGLGAGGQNGAALEEKVGPSDALISKDPKPIRRFKRIVLIYGSIAAMFFIAFSLWKLNDTAVIYLENNQELARMEPVEKEMKEDEGSRMVHEDVSGNPERLPIALQQTISASLPAKAVYTSLKKEEVPVRLDATKSNALGRSIDRVGLVESELALVPIEIVLERKEVLAETNEDLVFAFQEPIMDAIEDQHAVYEEVKSSKNKKIGVSTILNFLAKGFSGEDGSSIEFSENEEGILQWDIKSSLAKTPQ